MRYLLFIFVLLSMQNVLGINLTKIKNDKYCTKIFITDSVEISLYTPTMFRFRISRLSSDRFPEKYEIPFLNGHTNPWQKTACKINETDKDFVLETARLVVKISKKDLSWNIFEQNGKKVYPSEGPVFGMFRDGYSIFDNASSFGEKNKNNRYSHWFYNPQTQRYTDTYLAEDKIKDTYFIYGPDYPALFVQFNQLTGAEPLLPKKAYGFFQTQHLACEGTQEKFMQVASEFRKRDIPCDNLILDFEWGDGCDGTKEIVWGSRLDWADNYKKPLSPQKMVDSLKILNYSLMLIHHNAPTHANRFDQGWTESLYDEQIWWKSIKAELNMGVAGTWQDTRRNNITDGEIWVGMQRYIGPEKRVYFMGCYNMQETDPWGEGETQIPVGAMVGNRRYPFHWVGDSDFTWSELKWQINAITNTHGAMKGVNYLTWDVYGKSPLIQARMNQFVDFIAVSRSHNLKPWAISSDIDQWKARIVIERELAQGSNAKNAERAAMEGEYTAEKSIQRHRKLRYRLLPYIYSFAFNNYLTGMPMCRPMLLQYPSDDGCKANQWPYQYMFGQSILVAPVYHDLGIHQIYLPAGQAWFDYWDKTKFKGGQVIDYNTENPDKLPLFIPEGGILVYGKERNWIIPEEQERILWLEIYPGRDGRFEYYEDDGVSTSYQQGTYGKTDIILKNGKNNEISILVSPCKGSFRNKLEKRIWRLRIPDPANQYHFAVVNGKKIQFGPTSTIEVTRLADESMVKELEFTQELNREVKINIK